MRKKSKKDFNHKKGAFAGILTILAIVGGITGFAFLFPHVLSEIGESVLEAINDILLLLIKFFGSLLGVFTELMIAVAQYNDFMDAPAVTRGWIIIRDVCNMFFIIVLLVIAFGTVFQIEKYSYKHLLGGLLLAAVLVNFSKLICGFIIDVGQVFMLTFVNAFKDVAVGNFANLLGIQELLALQGMSGEMSGLGVGEIFIDLFLAFILTLLSVVVVGALLIVLVIRIVVLWVLIIFSPFIFIAQVLPFTQSYARQYWSQFTSQVIVGPAIAFMLWLTLSLANVSISTSVNQALGQGGVTPVANPISAATSKISQATHLISYIFGIVMLVMCLTVGRKMGGIGGQLAGKAVAKVEGFAKGGIKLGGKAMKAATYREREEAKALGKRTAEGLARKIPLAEVLTAEGRQARQIRIKGAAEEKYGGMKGARERAEMEIRQIRRRTLEERIGPLKDKSDEYIKEQFKAVRPGSTDHKVYLEEWARRGNVKPEDLEAYIKTGSSRPKDIENNNFAWDVASQQGDVALAYLNRRYKRNEKGVVSLRGDEVQEDKEAKYEVTKKIRDTYSKFTDKEISLTKPINFDPDVYKEAAIEALLALDNKMIKKTASGTQEKIKEKLESIKKSAYKDEAPLIKNEKGEIVKDEDEKHTYAKLAQKKLNELADLELEKTGKGKGLSGAEGEERVGNIILPGGLKYDLSEKGRKEEEAREAKRRKETGKGEGSEGGPSKGPEVEETGEAKKGEKTIQSFQEKEEVKKFNSFVEKETLLSSNQDLVTRERENKELVEAISNLSKEIKDLAKETKQPKLKTYADKFDSLRDRIIDFNNNPAEGLALKSMTSNLIKDIRVAWSSFNNQLKKIVPQPEEKGQKKEEKENEEKGKEGEEEKK